MDSFDLDPPSPTGAVPPPYVSSEREYDNKTRLAAQQSLLDAQAEGEWEQWDDTIFEENARRLTSSSSSAHHSASPSASTSAPSSGAYQSSKGGKERPSWLDYAQLGSPADPPSSSSSQVASASRALPPLRTHSRTSPPSPNSSSQTTSPIEPPSGSPTYDRRVPRQSSIDGPPPSFQSNHVQGPHHHQWQPSPPSPPDSRPLPRPHDRRPSTSASPISPFGSHPDVGASSQPQPQPQAHQHYSMPPRPHAPSTSSYPSSYRYSEPVEPRSMSYGANVSRPPVHPISGNSSGPRIQFDNMMVYGRADNSSHATGGVRTTSQDPLTLYNSSVASVIASHTPQDSYQQRRPLPNAYPSSINTIPFQQSTSGPDALSHSMSSMSLNQPSQPASHTSNGPYPGRISRPPSQQGYSGMQTPTFQQQQQQPQQQSFSGYTAYSSTQQHSWTTPTTAYHPRSPSSATSMSTSSMPSSSSQSWNTSSSGGAAGAVSYTVPSSAPSIGVASPGSSGSTSTSGWLPPGAQAPQRFRI